MAAKQLKVSSFYGDKIARPFVVLDADGKTVQDRVDAPQVNEALLEWATRVPVKMGGTLVKPVYEGPEPRSLREARTDFQIFFTEQYGDILAANPALFAADRKAMLAAASVYWREQLSPEERAEYRRRAVEEKAAAAETVAEADAANPRFKAFREKLQSYKQSMRNILTAARVSSGPLWRAQRQLNAKYRLLDEQQAGEEQEQEGAEGAPLAGPSKPDGKARGAGGRAKGRGGRCGKKGAAQRRLVGGDSDSDLEDEAEDEEAAVAAMEKLMLATAKKGAKASPNGGKKAAASKRAGTAAKAKGKGATKKQAQEEEAVASCSSEEEAEEGSPQRRQRGAQRSRSGAAVLAQRVVSAAKGRKGYTGAFDLPPSQNTTPAKARSSAKNADGAKAAAAPLPAKSPGKRARNSRAAAVAQEAPAEESPAKKPRRSARK